MNMVRVRKYVRAAPQREARDMPKLFTGSPDPPSRKKILFPSIESRPSKSKAQIIALEERIKRSKAEKEFEIKTREAELKRFETSQKVVESREAREAKAADVELRKEELELGQLQQALSQKKRKLRTIPGGTVEERRTRAEIQLIESQARVAKKSLGGLRQQAKREREEARTAAAQAKQAEVLTKSVKEDLKLKRLEIREKSLQTKERIRAQKERLRLQAEKLRKARRKGKPSRWHILD